MAYTGQHSSLPDGFCSTLTHPRKQIRLFLRQAEIRISFYHLPMMPWPLCWSSNSSHEQIPPSLSTPCPLSTRSISTVQIYLSTIWTNLHSSSFNFSLNKATPLKECPISETNIATPTHALPAQFQSVSLALVPSVPQPPHFLPTSDLTSFLGFGIGDLSLGIYFSAWLQDRDICNACYRCKKECWESGGWLANWKMWLVQQ